MMKMKLFFKSLLLLLKVLTDELSSDEGETETPSNTTMSFGHQVTWHWNKCKQRIEHEYSIAAWALCVMESSRADVRE